MGGVHPIEHLRYLARADDIDPTRAVPEAAEALHALAYDRNALVLACRKLVEHHPGCGPLWWLAAQALTDPDARSALRAARRTFEEDPTELHLSLALADTTTAAAAEPVVVRCQMLGPAGASGCDEPPPQDRPLWVICGVGTTVPSPIQSAAPDEPAIPLAAIDRVIRPTGSTTATRAVENPDVHVVPELLPRG